MSSIHTHTHTHHRNEKARIRALMGDYNNAFKRNNNIDAANVRGRVKTQNRANVSQSKAVIMCY